MDCFNCDNVDNYIQLIHQEEIPCENCDHETKIYYWACLKCKAVWKTSNGVILNSSVFKKRPTEKDIENLVGMVSEFTKSSETSMDAYVSNHVADCIMCGETAYKNDNTFRCWSCDFEWEILESE